MVQYDIPRFYAGCTNRILSVLGNNLKQFGGVLLQIPLRTTKITPNPTIRSKSWGFAPNQPVMDDLDHDLDETMWNVEMGMDN